MRQWLRDLRKKNGSTQAQIAEKCGVTRASYASIELNIRNPSPKLAQKIGNVLEFPWTDFFETVGCDMLQK